MKTNRVFKAILISFLLVFLVLLLYLFVPGKELIGGRLSELGLERLSAEGFNISVCGNEVDETLELLGESGFLKKILNDKNICTNGDISRLLTLTADFGKAFSGARSLIGSEFVLFIGMNGTETPDFFLISRPGWKEVLLNRTKRRILNLSRNTSNGMGIQKIRTDDYLLNYIFIEHTLILSGREDLLKKSASGGFIRENEKSALNPEDTEENIIKVRVNTDMLYFEVECRPGTMDLVFKGECGYDFPVQYFPEEGARQVSCQEFDGVFGYEGRLDAEGILNRLYPEVSNITETMDLKRLFAVYFYGAEDAGYFIKPDAVLAFDTDYSPDKVQKGLERISDMFYENRLEFRREVSEHKGFKVDSFLSPVIQVFLGSDGETSLLSFNNDRMTQVIDNLVLSGNNKSMVINADGQKICETLKLLIPRVNDRDNEQECGLGIAADYLRIASKIHLEAFRNENGIAFSGNIELNDIQDNFK